MSIEGDMRERHGRVLAELAESGMVMVRRLSEAMLRTDDVQTQAQLGLAYHRVSRAVRQTMALEFRLMQEPRREERAALARTPPPETRPPRPPTERTGWNEYESDDSDEALDELDALLDAEDVDLDDVHDAVETCIANIRRDLDADRALVETGPPGAPPPGRLSSPVGGGGPPEGRWRGNTPAAVTSPAGPLHHAAHGPPPPTGEERRGLNATLESRLALDSGGRRSALMGSGAPMRPLAPPRPHAPAWRSSG